MRHGLSFDDKDYWAAASDDDFQEEILKKGLITKEQLKKILLRNSVASGIVLGINKDALTDFRHSESSSVDEEHELEIFCPDGVDIKYIPGLEPGGAA